MPSTFVLDEAAFHRDGFTVCRGELISRDVCHNVATALSNGSDGSQRHLVDHPAVRELLAQAQLSDSIKNLLGQTAFAYKATLFDKSQDSNWLVAWHQDLSIPVSRRIDLHGWHGWSVKQGVHYVQPPDHLLAKLLAVRIHLDACNKENGPLRVLAGSHLMGRASTEQLVTLANEYLTEIIDGNIGSALFMRPLLIHASSKARSSARRRVLHLEFAAQELPDGLDWHQRVLV